MKVIEAFKAAGYDVKTMQINKNGKEVSAYSISRGVKISVCLYDNFEVSPEEFEKIKSDYDEKIAQQASICDDIVSRETLLQNVIVAVRPASAENIVKKTISEDMEAYLRIVLPDMCTDDYIASVIVKHTLLEQIGISESEVWQAAEQNTKDQFIVKNMVDVLKEFLPGFFPMDEGPSIFVITNKKSNYAAGALGCSWFVDELKKRFPGQKKIVIPSSIHELLIVDAESNGSAFTEMVKEVNATQVAENERLCDRAIFFDGTDLQLAG